MRRTLVALPLLLVVTIPPPPAFAGPWIIRNGITVRETYTDNVNLAPPGEERSDFVTDITPRFSIRSGEEARGRIDANFDYQLQTFTIGGGDAPNSLNHRFQANGTAEVWEQMAFVDFRGSLNQVNLTNTGAVSDDNIADTGNRVDVLTYAVSPYMRHHLGTYADTELRYTFDDVMSEDDSVTSSSTGFSGLITSGRRFARLPWSVSTRSQEIDNERGADNTFRRVEGTLGYRINRLFTVTALAGYDDNEFPSRRDTSGFRWRLGGTWTPSRRTSISAGYGGQFSGPSFSFNLSHRSRRTEWRASFEEVTSTTRQVLIDRQLIPLVDLFGDPVFDDTGAPILVPLDIETLTTEVIVRTRFQASMAARGRKTTYLFTVFDEEREFQLTGDTEAVVGIIASVNHRMNRRMSASASARWQQTDVRTGTREDELWRAEVELTRRFGEDINGTLGYRYLARTSTDPGAEFDENRVSARVSVSF